MNEDITVEEAIALINGWASPVRWVTVRGENRIEKAAEQIDAQVALDAVAAAVRCQWRQNPAVGDRLRVETADEVFMLSEAP